MKILVSLLGLAPGTVTGVFYALKEHGYGTVDRVVTLTTNSPHASACERLIASELARVGNDVSYKQERIQAEDLEDVASTGEFQERIAHILGRERMGGRNQVFLSVAGGRKSMAALAAVAAQLYPPDAMFHLYVSDELERQGDIHTLQANPGLVEKCLRPAPDDYTLVQIPFFAVDVFAKGDDAKVSPEQLRLILVGEANRFAADYAREHPEILEGHPRTKHLENLQAYLFEAKVADYLKTRVPRNDSWDRAESHYWLPGQKKLGDIDVYAERTRGYEREVLACECKLFMPETESPSLPLEKVRQLLNKLPALQSAEEAQGLDRLEAWVVTNAERCDDDAARLATQKDIRLMHAELPRGWHRNVDWQVQAIRPFEQV